MTLSTFASIALLLFIIGVYSVMAFNVSLQRASRRRGLAADVSEEILLALCR